jgi:hypothetical protein
MAVTFNIQTHPVPPNERGVVQQFLEKDIDDDVDVKRAAKDTTGEWEARVIDGWHQPGGQEHLTVRVLRNGNTLYTAHVFRTGQVTAI